MPKGFDGRLTDSFKDPAALALITVDLNYFSRGLVSMSPSRLPIVVAL